MVLQLDLLRTQLEPATAREIEEILGFAKTGQGIVSQLLAYCKAGPTAPRTLVLARHLSDRRRLLEVAAGHLHSLEIRVLTDDHVAVHAGPSQLDQILLNLVGNARDAMPGGGNIVVALGGTEDWALLSVTDHGVGIDEAARDRIFEPFFTTKGAGTGLGLSTVFSIVQLHHGTVEVDTIPGRGTTFVVRLPRVEP